MKNAYFQKMIIDRFCIILKLIDLRFQKNIIDLCPSLQFILKIFLFWKIFFWGPFNFMNYINGGMDLSP